MYQNHQNHKQYNTENSSSWLMLFAEFLYAEVANGKIRGMWAYNYILAFFYAETSYEIEEHNTIHFPT